MKHILRMTVLNQFEYEEEFKENIIGLLILSISLKSILKFEGFNN